MAKKRSAKRPPRRRVGLLWVLAIAVAALAAVWFWQPWHPGGAGGSASVGVTQGEALYRKNCAECHGASAAGQLPGQPRGGMTANGEYFAPALNGTGHAWHHPPDMLFRIVSLGSGDKRSSMKGWQSKMSEGEIRGVLEYLMSLWPAPIRARYQQFHGG